MSNNSYNPISKLLDIDFPEVKKANWNNSYDLQTTADVSYCNPVFTDRILANTHVKLDLNQAAFANPTVAPLYGRFRVKYIAFWTPDRLYIPEWRDGDAMVGDDYPYPIVNFPDGFSAGDYYEQYTGNGSLYVPYTSLIEKLGMFPAMSQACDWSRDDRPTPSNAFALLSFWDIYRHYILNVQEPSFPIRVNSFIEEHTDNGATVPAQNPHDVMVSREDLDEFFRKVRTNMSAGVYEISGLYSQYLKHNIFPSKYVSSGGHQHQSVSPSTADTNSKDFVLHNNYHYGLPIAPLGADMFTSWVNNDTVELEKSTAKVDVSSGTLYMDSWIVASRISNKLRKTAFKNSDFAEYIDVQYGIKPPTSLTKPMFLGAFVSDIVFNDVISSVQGKDTDENGNEVMPSMDSNRNLGSRAGYGRGTDYDKHNFIEFTAQEPGTLMVLQIIQPEVFYFEGRDEMFDVQNFNEEFNPAFDGIGFTPLQRSTMNLVPSLALSYLGKRSYDGEAYSRYNTAIGQQPYGMRHMAKVNKLSGQMAEPGSYLPYSLSRSFNAIRNLEDTDMQSNNPTAPKWTSSYPVPEMFTNIFASFAQDNFQFYINWDYLKYQPISKQFLAFNH